MDELKKLSQGLARADSGVSSGAHTMVPTHQRQSSRYGTKPVKSESSLSLMQANWEQATLLHCAQRATSHHTGP